MPIAAGIGAIWSCLQAPVRGRGSGTVPKQSAAAALPARAAGPSPQKCLSHPRLRPYDRRRKVTDKERAMSQEINKVVLAFSGGLDTSVILKWLQQT
ncbi:MAG: hypothetical protein ACRCUI_05985, partial [Polymorphobacter sp.]